MAEGRRARSSASPVLEVRALRKSFLRLTRVSVARRTALHDVHLKVVAGEVHGFLGPNGAGKTTTMRIVTGLARRDAGEVRLFGHEGRRGLLEARTGAVIEVPRFPLHLTPERHLSLLARARGCAPARIDDVLDVVGLRERKRDGIRELSLGMRQRLALATALLPSPQLLLLDEPMNGLDPAGMRDMKHLLTTLAASGVAVLLSSHVLSDIEQLCDRVTIIDRGRTVAEGPLEALAAQTVVGRVRVAFRDDDVAAGTRALVAAGYGVERQTAGVVVVAGARGQSDVQRVLSAARVRPVAIDDHSSLEDTFIALTAERPT